MGTPRDPGLRATLEALCRRLAEAIGEREIPGPNPPPQFDGTPAGFDVLLDTELRVLAATPPWAQAVGVLQDRPELARHFADFVGCSLHRGRIEPDTMVREVLVTYIARVKRPGFDTEAFEGVYGEVEEYLFEDRIRIRATVPLVRFSVETERVDLAPGVRIDEVDHRAIRRILEQVAHASGPQYLGRPLPRFALHLDLLEAKSIGDREDAERTAAVRARAAMRAAASAIALTTGLPVSMPAIRFTKLGWRPGVFEVSEYDPEPPARSPYCRLNAAAAATVQKLWPEIAALTDRGKGSLGIALTRYTRAVGERELEDRMLDLMIACEAIYLQDGHGELAERLALRTAHFLSSDPRVRLEFKQFMKAAYDLRSRIAHGSDVPNTVKVDGQALATEDVAERLASIVRESLLKFLRTPRDRRPTVVTGYWDRLAVGLDPLGSDGGQAQCAPPTG